MSKISGNGLFGQKKKPAGWFHSKTKVVHTFPTIPDPIRTKLYLKITNYFYSKFVENHGFSMKITKQKLKLMRKPCYVI